MSLSPTGGSGPIERSPSPANSETSIGEPCEAAQKAIEAAATSRASSPTLSGRVSPSSPSSSPLSAIAKFFGFFKPADMPEEFHQAKPVSAAERREIDTNQNKGLESTVKECLKIDYMTSKDPDNVEYASTEEFREAQIRRYIGLEEPKREEADQAIDAQFAKLNSKQIENLLQKHDRYFNEQIKADLPRSTLTFERPGQETFYSKTGENSTQENAQGLQRKIKDFLAAVFPTKTAAVKTLELLQQNAFGSLADEVVSYSMSFRKPSFEKKFKVLEDGSLLLHVKVQSQLMSNMQPEGEAVGALTVDRFYHIAPQTGEFLDIKEKKEFKENINELRSHISECNEKLGADFFLANEALFRKGALINPSMLKKEILRIDLNKQSIKSFLDTDNLHTRNEEPLANTILSLLKEKEADPAIGQFYVDPGDSELLLQLQALLKEGQFIDICGVPVQVKSVELQDSIEGNAPKVLVQLERVNPSRPSTPPR